MSFSYPERLVPKPTYSLIANFTDEDILCRGVNGDYPLKDETGHLSPLAIEEIRIPGYSINKVPPSKTDDIKIKIKSEDLLKEWEPGVKGIIVEKDEFEIINNRNFFLFKVLDIQGYKSKFPYPFSQDSNKLNFEFKIRVVHKPLLINYSHFELQLDYVSEQGEILAKPSKKSQKFINANVRHRLIEISKFSLSDFNNF